jgi:hypothetical protein
MHRLVDQTEMRMQNRRAAIRAFESFRQRLQQTPEHERQRLEPLDGPFKIERRLERIVRHPGHQRRGVFATRQPLPQNPARTQPFIHLAGRERRQLPHRDHTPSAQRLEQRSHRGVLRFMAPLGAARLACGRRTGMRMLEAMRCCHCAARTTSRGRGMCIARMRPAGTRCTWCAKCARYA